MRCTEPVCSTALPECNQDCKTELLCDIREVVYEVYRTCVQYGTP